MIVERLKQRPGIGIGLDGGCHECAELRYTESAGWPIIRVAIGAVTVMLCDRHADELFRKLGFR